MSESAGKNKEEQLSKDEQTEYERNCQQSSMICPPPELHEKFLQERTPFTWKVDTKLFDELRGEGESAEPKAAPQFDREQYGFLKEEFGKVGERNQKQLDAKDKQLDAKEIQIAQLHGQLKRQQMINMSLAFKPKRRLLGLLPLKPIEKKWTDADFVTETPSEADESPTE